jgi:hypothetical protein
MPLLFKTVTPHTTLFQVDNTCESSKDVTRRGVIVDIMNLSTASKVKPISNFSRKIIHSKKCSTWFASSKVQKSMLFVRKQEL